MDILYIMKMYIMEKTTQVVDTPTAVQHLMENLSDMLIIAQKYFCHIDEFAET